MKVKRMQQGSTEWYQIKHGRIGGTRFGQVVSGRDNMLLFDLLEERASEWMPDFDQYIDDDMQFGIDNEPVARQLYSEQSGIDFEQVGVIMSDFCNISLASPDGVNIERGIVLEVKCTQNGAIHRRRYFRGAETKHMPQIINYFVQSDDVKEVHFVSYCPYVYQRPLVPVIFTAEDFAADIKKGRVALARVERELIDMEDQFNF